MVELFIKTKILTKKTTMTPTTDQLSPTKAINRIHYLDALRGIAVFAIFTANIPYLSGYFFIRNSKTLPWATFQFDEIF